MSDAQDPLRLVATMIQHEERIADLYTAFAETLAEDRAFWSAMAREERSHADLIRKLYGKIEDGEAVIDERKFKLPAVQTSLAYLEVLLTKAREGLSSKMALSTALQVERSMLERGFFEVFQMDAEDVVTVFQQLHEATARHLERLQKAWESREGRKP